MNAARTLLRPVAHEAARTWREGSQSVRTTIVVGLALMAVGLAHAVAFTVAGGPWQGPLAWRKPFAFGLSFGLTTVTVAWVVARLQVRRAAWLLTPLAWASVVEVGWVSVQRARGVPSHFNDGDLIDELAFMLAGAAVGVLVLTLVVTFALSWRRTTLPPALASAIRSGMAVLLVSQTVGGLMIQRGIVSLDSAGPASHAISPAGDLKVSHAIAMHAIQVLPVLALWLMAADRPPFVARTAVRLAALGYGVAVVATFVQAASGRALTDPGPVPLGLAVAALVVGAAAFATAARPAAPAPPVRATTPSA